MIHTNMHFISPGYPQQSGMIDNKIHLIGLGYSLGQYSLSMQNRGQNTNLSFPQQSIVESYSAESWPKTQFISFIVT